MSDLLSLPELYSSSSFFFSKYLDDENIASLNITDEILDEAIATTETATRKVRELALFSKGECIDEHPTPNLKYLFLDYYCAKFHSNWRNVDERLVHLMLAKRLFESFIEKCISLNALDTEDTEEIQRHEEVRNNMLVLRNLEEN